MRKEEDEKKTTNMNHTQTHVADFLAEILLNN